MPGELPGLTTPWLVTEPTEPLPPRVPAAATMTAPVIDPLTDSVPPLIVVVPV